MANPTRRPISGTEFLESIKGMSREQVEAKIEEMVANGNVPDFVRQSNFINVTQRVIIDGRETEVVFRVCRDYFAVGTNTDYVRVPMAPHFAQRLADRFGYVLPTRRMVDLIDEESRRQGGHMTFHAKRPRAWATDFDFQSRRNDEEVQNRGLQDVIRSRHKKDVVYDPIVFKESHEGGPPVVIYLPGLQPLSNFHNETYYDYSHGIRMIDPMVTLSYVGTDGRRHEERKSVAEIVRDANRYWILSGSQMDISTMYRRTAASVIPAQRRRM